MVIYTGKTILMAQAVSFLLSDGKVSDLMSWTKKQGYKELL